MVSCRGSDTKAIIQILTASFKESNWVSHFSIATILGVAGYALAFRNHRFSNFNLFSPREEESDKDDCFLVPGLQNLGNNCFLNVILQALASSKEFQSFLQWVIEAVEEEEEDEQFPLTLAMSTLLQELCIVGRRSRSVCSPHKVMLALTQYVKNFNLTSQQDAAEALLHLISSLQEEIVVCYRRTKSRNLSEIMFSRNLRMLAPSEGLDGLVELKRWHRHLRGPFNGILSSMLMCRICSSQISLEFQFFHTLPLSPLLHTGSSDIMLGCTLENCLNKFLAAEKVENYFCQRCWHSAALKYLSVVGAAESDIKKIKTCGRDDDECDCKTSQHLERMPWSNSYSNILKQLSIARFPKILCIQVQRASLNMFGESIKLSGHIAFPLVLDLSLLSPPSIGLNIEKSQIPEYQNTEESRNRGGMYRLVAVVEHFGRTGSGHYTVYRSLRMASQEEEEECEDLRWFSISDTKVYRVSESDVLGAEASLLFYETL